MTRATTTLIYHSKKSKLKKNHKISNNIANKFAFVNKFL